MKTLQNRSLGTIVLLTAFTLRVLAIPTSVFRINPYSTSDAVTFSNKAQMYSQLLLQGIIPEINIGAAGPTWGIILAPFWLLPGPSAVYARIVIALLGAIAAYNVYRIGTRFHSPTAGILASFPLVFFPSFVIIHATLLREAPIVFGLTSAVRIATDIDLHDVKYGTILGITSILTLASVLRKDNVPIYFLTIVVWAVIWYGYKQSRLSETIGSLSLGGLLGIVVLRPKIRYYISELARFHRKRAEGRTAYLPNVYLNTLPEAIPFSIVGAVYFFFTPFPWMIETPADVIVFVEAVLNLAYALAGVGGVIYASRRNLPATMALVFGFCSFAFMYGIATANVGTAVRHRQMFVWVLYLFGGIFIASRSKWSLSNFLTS